MRRRVRIDRIVLRGTAVDPVHAERLRALVAAELARSLAPGASADAAPPVPADPAPELLAQPIARQIAARLPQAVTQ